MQKLKVFLLVCFIFSWLNPLQAQTYQPNWASLDQRSTPNWWSESKFGIFIHWGVYSVPAYAPVNEEKGVYEKYAEHYENKLLGKNEFFTKFHNKYFGPQVTYQDFAPQFKAEYFNPDEWASLFEKSGAKYVVLTSKHHDGFCLWPSSQSPKWNSVDIGPHKDIIGELSNSVKKKGLHMGLYYSLLEWNHPLYNAKNINAYVDQHMIPQLKDLVNRYSPEVIFADGDWDYPSSVFKTEGFLSWLYNESPIKKSVAVNDRWGKETRGKHGGYYTTEYDLGKDEIASDNKVIHPWEESRGIGTSYGYNKFETAEHYSSSANLIKLLIEKVAGGGNLLLDIGPDANGLIPVVMQERLLDMGAWLKVNGEAIYNTTAVPAKLASIKNKDIHLTKKGNDLYVLCTQWPDKPIIIDGLSKLGKTSMLGLNKKIQSHLKNGKLIITPPTLLPNQVPCQSAWSFKIENIL